MNTPQGSAVERYLDWIVREYGPDERVGNLNCVNGWDGPFAQGEYASLIGRAGELLERVRRGEQIYIPGIGSSLS